MNKFNIFKMMQIKFLTILSVFSLFTIFNLEASENSLDDEYKIRILFNSGGYKLIVVDGEEIGSIGDSTNRNTEGNFDFSLMFPDNYSLST